MAASPTTDATALTDDSDSNTSAATGTFAPTALTDNDAAALNDCFASYVPAAFTRAAVVDRVCRSILEDVGPCLCATPGGAATDADCRNASLYTRTFFAAAPPGGAGECWGRR